MTHIISNISPKNEIEDEFELHFGRTYSQEPESFPKKGIEALRLQGFMMASVPLAYGGEGLGQPQNNKKLYRTLEKVGAYDLCLGRIYEGHVNALSLIETFGSIDQKQRFFDEAKKGHLFGVWNSELPFEPVSLNRAETDFVLKGAKIFCSGANHVSRAIITANLDGKKQMVVIPMEAWDLEEDYSYWNPMGMKGSVSCRFDFSNLTIKKSQLLGPVDGYEREPDFSGGAIRFAAVQIGGAVAAIRATQEHISRLNRNHDPDQLRRMAQMVILRERGYLWLDKVALIADNKAKLSKEYVHLANMARIEIRSLCEEILHLCEFSVGLQGMMVPHPLERIHRDLSVYLKQPGPDRTLKKIGKYLNEIKRK